MNRFAARASVVVGSLAALLLGLVTSQAQMRPSRARGTRSPIGNA